MSFLHWWKLLHISYNNCFSFHVARRKGEIKTPPIQVRGVFSLSIPCIFLLSGIPFINRVLQRSQLYTFSPRKTIQQIDLVNLFRKIGHKQVDVVLCDIQIAVAEHSG